MPPSVSGEVEFGMIRLALTSLGSSGPTICAARRASSPIGGDAGRRTGQMRAPAAQSSGRWSVARSRGGIPPISAALPLPGAPASASAYASPS